MNKFFEGFTTWILIALVPVLMGWGVVSFTIWEMLPISEWDDYFRFIAGAWVAIITLVAFVP